MQRGVMAFQPKDGCHEWPTRKEGRCDPLRVASTEIRRRTPRAGERRYLLPQQRFPFRFVTLISLRISSNGNTTNWTALFCLCHSSMLVSLLHPLTPLSDPKHQRNFFSSSTFSFSFTLLSFLSSNFSIIIHSSSLYSLSTSSVSHSLLILLSFLFSCPFYLSMTLELFVWPLFNSLIFLHSR
jgi:hypothetical protein